MKKKRFDFVARQKDGALKKKGYMDMVIQDSGSGELYLYGDIVSDELTADFFGGVCPQAISDYFGELQDQAKVDVYINSGGGDVFAGLAIVNIMKRHTGQKCGHVDGLAASIASVILMACDTIYMGTGAQIMIHDPWTSIAGNATELRKMADDLDEASESILDVYTEKTAEGVTREQVAQAMHDETWMRESKASTLFQITATETPAAAACGSDMFGQYKNLPEAVKRGKKSENSHRGTEEARRETLLRDLYLYGTKTA